MEDYYFAYTDRYDLLVNINFTASNFSSKEISSIADFNGKYQDAQKIIKQIKLNKIVDGFEVLLEDGKYNELFTNKGEDSSITGDELEDE
ncbi:MAG: hypothetical protein ACERKN_18615 [Velocimicrobium sp.]